MAQDPPPGFGREYPHGSDGHEPVGYDYQQAWYPAAPLGEEQPPVYGTTAPPYDEGAQQPWQWQEQQAGQAYSAEAAYGYAETGTAQPEIPGYDAATGYDASATGHDASATGYDAATAGYDASATGYDPTAAYDPAAIAEYDTVIGQQPVPGLEEPAEPAGEPDPAADAAEPAAPRAGRSRAGASSTSLVDRVRAAAGGLLADTQGPGRRTLLIRTGAGLGALVVLLTAGVIATSHSGGSGSSAAAPPSSDTGFATSHNKIWTAQPASAPQPGTDDTLVGSWLLSSAIVRADGSGVNAYDLGSGKQLWSVAAPAQGAVPCGLSPTVNQSGLGAALFRTQANPQSPCSLLAAVDTKTGKTVWTKTLSNTTNSYSAHVAVTNDRVIVVADDKAAAWNAADGNDAWQYGGPGKFCNLSGSASGGTVLLHSYCVDTTPNDQAVALSTEDGHLLWWRGLNNQPKSVTVLSAEPAVVLTTGDQPTDSQVFAFGSTGDPTVQIAVNTPAGQLDVTHGGFDPVPGVFFQGHTMVTTLVPSTGGTASTTVVGYDLGTGKAIWQSKATEKGPVAAVGLDNGSLVLAADERVLEPAHLSRFNLANGQESVGGGFPKGTGSLLSSGLVLIGEDKDIVVPQHSGTFGIATAFQAASN
ncbi:PQQ-binding-like beta-propeller repeat protein [Kitasatospora sp. NPDC052896]|uniref:outer membrane protein assembly factor BamB family protein n=1 Tax=Kitasatospora sp. NPDC052896 TaxID=3364061 RepID=UPI0037C64FD2